MCGYFESSELNWPNESFRSNVRRMRLVRQQHCPGYLDVGPPN